MYTLGVAHLGTEFIVHMAFSFSVLVVGRRLYLGSPQGSQHFLVEAAFSLVAFPMEI